MAGDTVFTIPTGATVTIPKLVLAGNLEMAGGEGAGFFNANPVDLDVLDEYLVFDGGNTSVAGKTMTFDAAQNADFAV